MKNNYILNKIYLFHLKLFICGKTLRILLLQNNVISKLQHLEMKYFKVLLEYLNLALNNIRIVHALGVLHDEN